MDFTIALLLFIFTLAIYFNYTNNSVNREKNEMDNLIADARSISSSLVLSGYPSDWDNASAVRIGIANEQRIDAAKIKLFKQLGYNSTKRKFGTLYDYFVFFTNSKGEVLNVNGVCGIGNPIVSTTHDVKSAYYYQDPADSFLKEFMDGTFKADIYFGNDVQDISDIDALINNLSKYSFIVMEHPLLSASDYNQFKDELGNYSSSGGLLMISGELATAQGKNLFGADFYKKSGQSVSDRNSTVNNTDQHLSLSAGEHIVFSQAYYVDNTSSAAGFKIIASFNQDGNNALAKWGYGNGTVYFFSDFGVSYFNGDFAAMVEDGAQALVEGTCTPVDLSNADIKTLAKTERYLIYNSKVIKMVVYLWQ
ncbi:hypothetical protein HYW20_07890 [Candidatus Woesearchaeota archaeon]|nr:hypothetical protein [Candidatus Woesearchaeota archaeon]